MLDIVDLTTAFSRLVATGVTADIDQRPRELVEQLVRDAARVYGFVESVRLAAITRLDSLAAAHTDSAPSSTADTSASAGRGGGGCRGGDPDRLLAQHGRQRDTDAGRGPPRP
ncbi:MAG: hypothetical protein WD023_11690, partial [Ilumatobacteraceae bacterium]